MSDQTIRRDERGRPIGDDGYPMAGNATVSEAAAASSLSESYIYALIQRGDLRVQRFGRAVRIPWDVVRERFMTATAVSQ